MRIRVCMSVNLCDKILIWIKNTKQFVWICLSEQRWREPKPLSTPYFCMTARYRLKMVGCETRYSRHGTWHPPSTKKVHSQWLANKRLKFSLLRLIIIDTRFLHLISEFRNKMWFYFHRSMKHSTQENLVFLDFFFFIKSNYLQGILSVMLLGFVEIPEHTTNTGTLW